MAISPSAHYLELNSQAALFCDRAQQLFHLNPSAAEIWKSLAEGWTCQSVADCLEREGLSQSEAFTFVVGIVEQWLAAGHMLPVDIVSAASGPPKQTQRLSIGPVGFSLRFFGNADIRAFDNVFGHLRTSEIAPKNRFDIVEQSGAYFLIKDGQPIGMTSSVKVIPLLKAVLTEACCDAAEDGFLAHGALLYRNGKRVFITGAPGAGKTTLTMGLLSSGFSFCGDDIVHIDPAGLAAGLPFAAAAKSGSWELLASLHPGLLKMDVHERADGQLVRYIVPENRDKPEARAIDVVVVLSRDTASPARAEELQPLDSLCEIVGSGYSPHRRMDAPTVQALAKNLARASHYRLIYSDLAGGVAAVTALT